MLFEDLNDEELEQMLQRRLVERAKREEQRRLEEQLELQKLHQEELELMHKLEQVRTSISMKSEREILVQDAASPSAELTPMIGPCLEYRGVRTSYKNGVDLYTDAFKRIWVEYPNHRDAIIAALGFGRKRTYVARTRDALNTPRPLKRYSRRLVDGWYIDTNQCQHQRTHILKIAVSVVKSLSWDQDVKVHWGSRGRVPVATIPEIDPAGHGNDGPSADEMTVPPRSDVEIEQDAARQTSTAVPTDAVHDMDAWWNSLSPVEKDRARLEVRTRPAWTVE